MKFAIKSACYGTLHNVAEADNTNDIDISYINQWDLGAEETTLEARAQGKTAITLSSDKKMNFTVNAEVLDEDGLMLLVGGTKKETGEIIVGDTPSTVYKFEGIAHLSMEDGSSVAKKITIPKCRPRPSDSVSFSATELSTFSLQFDILYDATTNAFLTIADNA